MKTNQPANQKFVDHINSEMGLIEVTATDVGISSVYFAKENSRRQAQTSVRPNQYTEQAKQQLSEYLSHQRQTFELTLDPQQGTDFQKRVWQALLSIPYGQTASYLHIAEQINHPKAVRAVGAANGKNPISIIVPCHRVIGANGTLTGYAGGLARKQWLLQHERDSPFQI